MDLFRFELLQDMFSLEWLKEFLETFIEHAHDLEILFIILRILITHVLTGVCLAYPIFLLLQSRTAYMPVIITDQQLLTWSSLVSGQSNMKVKKKATYLWWEPEPNWIYLFQLPSILPWKVLLLCNTTMKYWERSKQQTNFIFLQSQEFGVAIRFSFHTKGYRVVLM